MRRSTHPVLALDWKLPVLIFFLYAFCCYLYNFYVFVPGTISIKGLVIFLLPYLGASSALYLHRDKPLFFDPPANEHDPIASISASFIFLLVSRLIPLIFLLQLITWIYIFNFVDSAGNVAEFFSLLRDASIGMNSLVPIWLSYPNGLCFASFCLAFGCYRYSRSTRCLILLAISVLSIFLNDLQTSGRAGMVFVVFAFLSVAFWDWRANKRSPLAMGLGVVFISIFTQLPKVLRDGSQTIPELYEVFQGVIRYCFSYLNTLTELLNRLPEPNFIGQRTFLPIFNLASRFNFPLERSAIHSIERSQIWGFNNYTMAGEFIRDFSYFGCFIVPFLIASILILFASRSSRVLNIAISIFFSSWLIYGSITNIFMFGGFFISISFLFALTCIEKIYHYRFKS